MDCSNDLLMARLLDGELDEVQAELAAHHLDGCVSCRAVVKELAEERAFVQDRLGEEDESEEASAAAALAAVASRLPTANSAAARGAGLTTWLRRPWLGAAAAMMLALLLPDIFGSRVGASPERIIEEAIARERIWSYQPNKTLHWEVETSATGVHGMTDGRWRTHYWQKNDATTLEQTVRQFDPDDRTVRATWRRADGSTLNYSTATGDVVELAPSTAEARAALRSLSPALRQALQSYIDRGALTRSLDAQSRREADWLSRPGVGVTRATAALRRSVLREWGEVYHVTITNDRPTSAAILRAVHEYDIEKSSYRILRLKSTVSYADGTTGVHDSSWTNFRETSEIEFDAHAPHDLLDGSRRIVRLSPLDVATRWLQEQNRSRTTAPNQ
jgi:hypothetical protein